jgi:hypothetical protein
MTEKLTLIYEAACFLKGSHTVVYQVIPQCKARYWAHAFYYKHRNGSYVYFAYFSKI